MVNKQKKLSLPSRDLQPEREYKWTNIKEREQLSNKLRGVIKNGNKTFCIFLEDKDLFEAWIKYKDNYAQ